MDRWIEDIYDKGSNVIRLQVNNSTDVLLVVYFAIHDTNYYNYYILQIIKITKNIN